MTGDPLMGDWAGPVDETYFVEQSRRSGLATTPVPAATVALVESVPVVPVVPGVPGGLVAPPGNPMAVSRQLVADRFTADGLTVVRAWRNAFHAWDGRCWPERDEREIRAILYRFLEHAVYEAASGTRPWEPTRSKVANVLEALRAVVHLPDTVQPPAWIEGGRLDPHDLIVTTNGILHVPTRDLLPHDPRLFVVHSVPFDYDAGAPVPARWLDFLGDLWGDDEASIALLQEVFGYVLSGDTSMQKICLLVGPTRAGKGVLANVLSALTGRHNVGAPTLAGLTTNFGLQDLIGKSLAVVSDARLGKQANVAALAERLLSISGEDAITIDRKYKDPWTGRLGVRFLLLTNELPRFTDASGALAKRFLILVLTRSVYGREDPALLSKLLPELPGILNWSLDGLDRLRAQRHFSEPASARDAVRELEDLASPVTAFLRDRCLVGRDQSAPVDGLWTAWKSWCEDGSQHHGTKQTFGRDLRSAIPGLRVHQPRDGAERHRVYLGVGLQQNNGPDRVPRVPEDDVGTGGTRGTRSNPLFSRGEPAHNGTDGTDGTVPETNEDDYPPSALWTGVDEPETAS